MINLHIDLKKKKDKMIKAIIKAFTLLPPAPLRIQKENKCQNLFEK